MLTFGIETSGRAGSIALVRDGQVLEEVELSATGRRHARTLVPEIGALLGKHSLSTTDLNLVAVSIGPGSFTGLRVGVVCAKTLAYAIGCDVIGVDTFEAVTSQTSADVEQLWVIEDALRGDVSAGKYLRTSTGWSCEIPPQLVALEEWLPDVQGEHVSGPAATKFAEELTGVHLIEESIRIPQASSIALVGEAKYRAGHKDDPWTLQPHYMRRSAAEEKADAAK